MIQLNYGGDTTPPPLFLGQWPLTFGVQAVAALHIVFCFFVIATASSAVSFSLGRFVFPPIYQVCVSAWSLLGVFLIVGTNTGLTHMQEFPIRMYFNYSAATTVMWAVFFVVMVEQAADCTMVESDRYTQRNGSEMTCGLLSAVWFFVLLAFFVCSLFGTYTVWQMADWLHKRENSEFDTLEDPFEKSRQKKAQKEAAEDAQWRRATPGPQPMWGSVNVKSMYMHS